MLSMALNVLRGDVWGETLVPPSCVGLKHAYFA